MEEKQQWLSIGAIALVVAGLGFFLYRQSRQDEPVQILDTQSNAELETKANEVAEKMRYDIPPDADRANLKSLGGVDSVGVATRKKDNGMVDYAILAALPEASRSAFYEAYISDGDTSTYLGKLTEAKGGWKFQKKISETDIKGETIRVTQETVNDQKPESVVLEGSFVEPQETPTNK